MRELFGTQPRVWDVPFSPVKFFFSLLVFRYAAWRFRVQSVMCYLHTPSFTCRASCLTKNFRR